MDCNVLSYVFRNRKVLRFTNHYISQKTYELSLPILHKYFKDTHFEKYCRPVVIKRLQYQRPKVLECGMLNFVFELKYKTVGYKMIMAVLTDHSFQ